MKTYLNYIAPAFLAITVSACSTTPTMEEADIQRTYQEAVNRDIIDSPCDYPGRKVTKEITNAKGVIVNIMKQDAESDSWAISIPETGERYTACSLPKDFKIEGTPVIFSGEAKEIFPNEYWMATPFKLTDIQLQIVR